MAEKVLLSVWSDYVCPFCYLEEPVLERIKLQHGTRIEVEWRAFELRPDHVPTLDPDGEYLHSTWEKAVYPMAAERRMTLRLPPVQPRSRKAFEAERFARHQGLGEKMRHALFLAFFESGRDIGKLDVLQDIGRAIGLSSEDLHSALQEGRFAREVEEDERQAQHLGITGVPAILARRVAEPPQRARFLAGAQPFEVVNRIVGQLLA